MISKFQPLSKKYAFLLDYGDVYSEMYENCVECIYKIPLNKLRTAKDNTVVLACIKTAMKNTYIVLSKKSGRYKCQIPLEEMDFQKKYDGCYQVNFEDYLFEDELKKILCPKEVYLLQVKFLNGYSESEIAGRFRMSRQAVNKQYQKILKKIKEFYKKAENK